jgi:hypothetical protein
MNPISFAAPWDKQLKVSSSLVGVLLLTLMILLPSATSWELAIRGGIPLLVAGLAAWSPREYMIDGDALIIKRWIGSVRIPLVGLTKARLMEPAELRGAVRTWAVGGFCGYYGSFLCGFEAQTWYVTDRQRCLRLDCDAGVVVISPSDPASCLAALEQFRTR